MIWSGWWFLRRFFWTQKEAVFWFYGHVMFNTKWTFWSVQKCDYRNWCNGIQLNLACAQKSRCAKPYDFTKDLILKKMKKKTTKIHKVLYFFLINFGMCQRITLTSSYNCVVTISNNASKSCSRITNSLFEKSKTFKDATEGKQCIVQYQAHTLFSPMPFCQPNISYREGEWQGVVHLHVMYKTRRNNTNNNKCCVFKSSSYFNFSAVRTITIDMCFVTRIWQNKSKNEEKNSNYFFIKLMEKGTP